MKNDFFIFEAKLGLFLELCEYFKLCGYFWRLSAEWVV